MQTGGPAFSQGTAGRQSELNSPPMGKLKGLPMPREIGTRAQIALLLYSTINVALFTVGVYVVMLSPALTENAGYWIALIVGASLLVTAPFAWCLASCMCGDRWTKKIVAKPSPLANTPSREI